MQYSEHTIYGINLIIKDYAHFPRFLPLPCHLEHGWTPLSNPLVSDLEVDKPIMLVFSRRRLEAWKAAGKSPAYIMGAPFAHYRKIHKITKKPNSTGTVVFPSHSTANTKAKFDVEKFCRELKGLPQEFHPITICLFWPDFIDGNADIYRRFGFSVTTAGPRFKKGLIFVKNFYNILSRHKYATSNEVGSFTFYAVDLKIPFFITGETPLNINMGGNKDIGKTATVIGEPYGKRAVEIFSTGPITKITPIQERFVAEEIGANDCLSPMQMNKLLWKTIKSDKNFYRGILIYWAISLTLALGFMGSAAIVYKKFSNFRNKFKKDK